MTDRNSHQKTAGWGCVSGWCRAEGVCQGWCSWLLCPRRWVPFPAWTTERKTPVCGADLFSQPLGGRYRRIRSSKPVSVNTGVQRPAWDLVSKKKVREEDRQRQERTVCVCGGRVGKGEKTRKEIFPLPKSQQGLLRLAKCESCKLDTEWRVSRTSVTWGKRQGL